MTPAATPRFRPAFFPAARMCCLLAFLAACEEGPCPDLPATCEDRLNVGFDWQVEQPEGDFEIRVVADGETSECTITIPADPDPLHTGYPCGDSVAVVVFALGKKLDSLAFRGAPDEVVVTISLAGSQLAMGTFEPMYERVGERPAHCGPTCVFDSAWLTID